MRILLLAPRHVLDWDPVTSQIVDSFSRAGHACAAVDADTGGEWDIVIPFDSMLTQYVESRASFKGRPWVLSTVYRGSDIIRCHEKFGPNPMDWGVNALMVSSPHYVTAMPSLSNAIFCWRPEHPDGWVKGEDFEKRKYLFGSVVDKVEDQDFCLAARVARKYYDQYVLFVGSEEEKEALPAEVKEFAVIRTKETGQGYSQFSFYVPTPRVTDCRCGMVPYEYIQAMMNGCWPLLISHPSIKPLEAVLGSYQSLNGFDSMLESAGQLRAAGGRLFNKEDCEKFMSTPEEFVRRVLIAHSRTKKNDA